MKHTAEQKFTSRNRALMRRAGRLGAGISMVALSAMLAARPVKAEPSGYAQARTDSAPSNSNSFGFVTSDSQQTNTAIPITSTLADTFDTSTISDNSALESPSTATVLDGTEAAYATGNAATNTVDLANIGASEDANGLSVLSDQANTYTTTDISTPTSINSTLSNSGYLDQVDNPAGGDSLAVSNNLVAAQTTGNTETSSVNGVVPVNYDDPTRGRTYLQYDLGRTEGNIVVASSQTNDGLQADAGSYATLNEYEDGFATDLSVDNTTDAEEDLALALTESGNTMSAAFTGNSANNGIGVALTAGGLTGAPTFYGSLVESNSQANFYTGDFITNTGDGAVNEAATITTQVFTADEGSGDTFLADGSSTLDDNTISAAAAGNSAIGAAGGSAPGNEISLGINLSGATTDPANLIIPQDQGGGLVTAGDLALTNLQNNDSLALLALVEGPRIYTYVQGLTGSGISAVGNAITADAFGSEASNAIDTSAGINLISGVAALTSLQDGYGASFAKAETDQSYAGEEVGYAPQGDSLSMTNSTVTVADTKQTVTAGVNLVTNAVSLASSGLAAGAEGLDTGPVGAAITSFGISRADAGVSLNNAQFTQDGAGSGAYLSSAFTGAQIGSYSVSNSSVSVSNSTFGAADTSNSATDTVSLDGSQGITGSAALANDQLAEGGAIADVAPLTYRFGGLAGIQILAYGTGGTGVTDSSATLAGSAVTADAADNFADNFLTATGGEIADDYVGTLGLAAQFSAPGAQATDDLALDNVQLVSSGSASASLDDSGAGINVDSSNTTISGSAFTVSGPAGTASMQALAAGNEASNAVSVSASTVLTDTAGLVNDQTGQSEISASMQFSDIGITANGTSTYLGAPEDDGGDISDSSFTVGTGAAGGSNGNLVRALAYANQASNSLSVSAGTLAPADTVFAEDGVVAPEEPPFDTDSADNTGVGAAYGVLNAQDDYGLVASEIGYLGTFIDLGNDDTNPSLSDVTAITDGNAVVAGVYGNEASNAASIAANGFSASSYYPLGAVANLQEDGGGLIDVLVSYTGEGFSDVLAGDGAVNDSTLDVSNNTALNQDEGNLATNSLDVTGGSIYDVSDEAFLLPGLVSSLDQPGTAQAGLALTVLNDQYGTAIIGVGQANMGALVATGGTLGLSTLTVDDNTFEALGYENNATSSLDLGGTEALDLLAASAGVENVQLSGGAVNVTLGTAGTLAFDSYPTTLATPAALITVAGSIAASTLEVSGNMFEALGIADNAVDTESLAATTLDGGADIPDSGANASVDDGDVLGFADYAVSNAQTVTAPVGVAAYGEAGINPTNNSTITSSSLIASDNTLMAEAEGAVADNTLTLTATNTVGTSIPAAATAALVSAQEVLADITAAAGTFGSTLTPGLIITAPGAIDDSTLTLDDNSSEALAVAGSAVNLLSVSATNLGDPSSTIDGLASVADETLANANYALANSQAASGYDVTATGVSYVANSDAASLTTTGLVSSTAALSGNTAAVYAETNAASNTLDLSAANSSVNAALVNDQSSADTVSATGAAEVAFSLNGSEDPDAAAATNSAINVSGNSLQVQGIGNQSSNALNADTGATYGLQTSADTGAGNTQATYAVLNSQQNAGGVTAQVPEGAVYGVALNGGGSDMPVANTTVTVSYNVVDAKAFGNSANNGMTVATLNSGNATAAEQNIQSNGGAVTASVTGASFGSAIGGPGASDTTVLVDNNSVVASGIGNVATNSIAH